MTIFQSILLGIVQGLTEFLPISSSGHLVIVPYLLDWEIPFYDAFIFNVLVQVATLIAVFTYFWNDLVEISKAIFLGIKRRQPFNDPQSKLGWFIIIATIPASLIGLIFKDVVERAFSNPTITGIFMLITAFLLLIAEFVGKRNRNLKKLNWKDALWIGLFQSFALFPGISRSGATITGGMTRDLERSASARFSFLISIPIMLIAGLAAMADLSKVPSLTSLLPTYIPGFIAAAITGYLAIRWLLGYLTNHPLYVFSIYCALLGLITLTVGFFR
jgi:undecaprenyl-diphosphatase